MPLLLDTCAAIWLVAGARVASSAEDALDQANDAREPVYVSPITGWEVGLLATKGRFASPHSPRVWFDRLLAIKGVRLAELSPAILIESSFLPGTAPRDPSDRIVIATAREFDLTVLTRDKAIIGYGEAGHVRTVLC